MVGKNNDTSSRHATIRVTNAEVDEISRLYAPDKELCSRISFLFWAKALVLHRFFGIDISMLMESIYEVEKSKHQITKPPTKFSHPPLRGLWHKHYFQPHFLAQNMYLELKGKKGIRNIVDEISSKSQSDYFTRDMIEEISRRVTTEAFTKRADKGQVTGEWVIFSKHYNNNFYLTCAAHADSDSQLFREIRTIAGNEFPHLKLWVALNSRQS